MKTFLALLTATCSLALHSLLGADAPKVIDVKVTGHGKPVILIPGLATPGEIWDETVKHLQGEYQCHVVTIAGFGGMPAVATDDLLGNVRDQLIAYIREHKLEKPIIIGHSLGGATALAIAEAAPDLPGDIICVDGLPFTAAVMLPGVQDVESARKASAAWYERMKGRTGESFAAYQRNVVIPSMVTKPEDVQLVAEMCGKSDPTAVGQAMNELLTRDLRPDLAKIKCPILVLGALGAILQYAPRPEIEKNYKSQFANAPQTRFQFFEKAKHFIMIDDPAGFQAALDQEIASR